MAHSPDHRQRSARRITVHLSAGASRIAPTLQRVREVLIHALRRHGCGRAEIGVAIVEADAMSRLNSEFHHHVGATDVLTFDMSEQDDVLEGQIVVCREVAEAEARRRGHSAELEMLLYIVHGALHLLGYDDHEPENAAIMHEEEDRILESLGIGRVFAARKA